MTGKAPRPLVPEPEDERPGKTPGVVVTSRPGGRSRAGKGGGESRAGCGHEGLLAVLASELDRLAETAAEAEESIAAAINHPTETKTEALAGLRRLRRSKAHADVRALRAQLERLSAQVKKRKKR